MPKIPTPRDAAGNEIAKDNLFVLQAPFPVMWKVIAVDLGGLHVANGMTPCVIRLVADITLRRMPGQPFLELLKTMLPTDQEALQRIMENLPTVPRGQ